MICKKCKLYSKVDTNNGYCTNESNERLFNKLVHCWFSCNKIKEK